MFTFGFKVFVNWLHITYVYKGFELVSQNLLYLVLAII